MNKIIFFLSLILFPLASRSESTPALWGKVVKADKTIQNVTYEYFVYFEKNGVPEAYPLETNKKDIADIIKKHVNQNVRFEGQVKEVTLSLDGPKQKVLVFIPTKAKPLTLSQLSIQDPVHVTHHAPKEKNKEEYRGALTIPDNVANAVIFTGAALMLGSALKNVIKKGH